MLRVIFNQYSTKKPIDSNMRSKNFYSPNSFRWCFFLFFSFLFAPNSFVRSKIIVIILSFVSSHIFISFHFFFFLRARASHSECLLVCVCVVFNSFFHSICILFFDYCKIMNKIGIDSRIRNHNEMKLDILHFQSEC